jgi:hypothetical protein
LTWVLEANLAHLEEWVWKLKLVVLSHLEHVVQLGLRNSFDEHFEVATVAVKLETVKVEDISNRVVEEA